MFLLFAKIRKSDNVRFSGTEENSEENAGDDEHIRNSVAGDDCKTENRCHLGTWLDRTEKRVPRLFNLTTVVALPLVFIICLAMLCGHFLASLESDNELDSLHDTMGKFLERRGQIRELVDSLENTYEKCFDEYMKTHPKESSNESVSITNLISYVEECRKEEMKQINAKVLELDNQAEEYLIDSLSLNWNKCFKVDGKGNKSRLNEQVKVFERNWLQDYDKSYQKHLFDSNEDEAKVKAIEDARIGVNDVCGVNTAGGAMFWFTIMTTIGYGNTAPKTIGGRAMVYTAGFFSIIIFTVLIGAAGYVFLTIADDFFETYKMKKLTMGVSSIVLWFFNLCFWLLILSGMIGTYDVTKYGTIRYSVQDRLWWAYISVTTVGFGDYYIPHDTFEIQDVWYVPLLMLMGFVNMANFLIKLSNYVKEYVKSAGITDDESLNYLLRQSRLGINIVQLDGRKFKSRPSLYYDDNSSV